MCGGPEDTLFHSWRDGRCQLENKRKLCIKLVKWACLPPKFTYESMAKTILATASKKRRAGSTIDNNLSTSKCKSECAAAGQLTVAR